MSEMLPVMLLLWVVLHVLSMMKGFVGRIGSGRKEHYEYGDASLGRKFRKAQRRRERLLEGMNRRWQFRSHVTSVSTGVKMAMKFKH